MVAGVVIAKRIFKSSLHTIYTEVKNKIALSSFDDKRYVIPGNPCMGSWIPSFFSIPSNKENPNVDFDLLIQTATGMVSDDIGVSSKYYFDKESLFYIDNYNELLF